MACLVAHAAIELASYQWGDLRLVGKSLCLVHTGLLLAWSSDLRSGTAMTWGSCSALPCQVQACTWQRRQPVLGVPWQKQAQASVCQLLGWLSGTQGVATVLGGEYYWFAAVQNG